MRVADSSQAPTQPAAKAAAPIRQGYSRVISSTASSALSTFCTGSTFYWAPEGLVEKAGAVVGADDHRVKGDLERFKEFIEKRGSATGSWQGEVQQD